MTQWRSTVRPYYSQDGIEIYLADAVRTLGALARRGVVADLILTDPPYNVSGSAGVGKNSIGSIERADGSHREIKRNFGEWDLAWNPRPFLARVPHVLRPGGSLVSFTSPHTWRYFLEERPQRAEPMQYRAQLFWHKANPAPSFRGAVVQSVETAIWLTRGGRWTFNAGGYRPNVWDYPVVGQGERVHPTQKPIGLMRDWISLFTARGGLVIDPYMGSGTTLRAAKDLGRRTIGIELDRDYCDAAIARLEQAALPLEDCGTAEEFTEAQAELWADR